MTIFWKIIGAVLITAILSLQIEQKEKLFGMLLCITVCCLGAAAMLSFLDPVFELLRDMEGLVRFQDGILMILVKCTGIVLVTELATLICQDCGSGSLSRMLHMLGTTVVIYLSLPMIRTCLDLIRDALGDI